jgi:hypothetical protein
MMWAVKNSNTGEFLFSSWPVSFTACLKDGAKLFGSPSEAELEKEALEVGTSSRELKVVPIMLLEPSLSF